MSPLFARATAILPIVAAVSLAGKEGFFYKLDASNKAVAIAAVTDVPQGLIAAVPNNDGLEISAAIGGGNHGTLRVKLGGAVTDLRKALALKADGTAITDPATGARVLVARPLETGVTDEMIECVLINPVSFAS